jgi:hypothetical protein
MKKLSRIGTGVAMALPLLSLSAARAQEAPKLTVGDGFHNIHIFPTTAGAAARANVGLDAGPLLYHTGGVVMTGSITTYAIFWVPAHLQNGGATSMSTSYQTVQKNLLTGYPGHGIDNNNTQYYQISGATTTYIQNKGSFGASYIDTNPYPASGCTDSATPGNCITDLQLQAEVQRVIAVNGWTGGLSKMFLVFTSSGEGSCFDSSGSSCAYVQYCAYHSYIPGSTPIVYSNEPYGNTSVCQSGGTPSPNNNAVADAAATSASHELTEAITDPELNAWYTSSGSEIGDLCAYNYGTNTWDAGKANQMWSGKFFELQTEYDNHTATCVQVGP